MARLTPEQWQAIRTRWEYDPDEPTYNVAAERASGKFEFPAPAKSSIDDRAKREGWQRRGNLNGINKAAQRKADKLVDSDGNRTPPPKEPDASGNKKANPAAEQAARDESEQLRAEVLARHRVEWKQIAVLRQEALNIRLLRPDEAFTRSKLAKINAEITAIQQIGERKAWGLDVEPSANIGELTDDELEALAKGKKAR